VNKVTNASYVEYKWVKTYAVNTTNENPVAPGDEIVVQDRNGGSKQRVLSVTTRSNQNGRPYKTLIVQAIQ